MKGILKKIIRLIEKKFLCFAFGKTVALRSSRDSEKKRVLRIHTDRPFGQSYVSGKLRVLRNDSSPTNTSEDNFKGIQYKEIVHPQVLLRIPCYDLSPVSIFTMDPNITSGASDRNTSHALTGGEYKTREHIHRDMSDSRLLAIPTSRSRVADSDPD